MRLDGIPSQIILQPDPLDDRIHRRHGQRQNRPDDAADLGPDGEREDDRKM